LLHTENEGTVQECLTTRLTSLPKVIWEEGRGAVAHVRPQKCPFSLTDPQTPLPASSLEASDLWCQTESGSNPPFCHNALDRPTDARTLRERRGL